MSLSLHHYYITTYYSNILIAVINIVYIILKVDIIVYVVYILITKLYDTFLSIVVYMCIIINKQVLFKLTILTIINNITFTIISNLSF